MSFATFCLYLVTWTLVSLSPGPAAMCVMSQATRHGLRASLSGLAGIQTGHVIFFSCIALGLASLLATATTAFATLRVIGAMYLLYLGLRVLISTFRRTEQQGGENCAPAALRGLFVEGLLIQLTNPKALLFVSALLPQFIDARRPFGFQITVLGIVTIVVDVIVMLGYATLASRGSRSLRNSRAMKWIERAFGGAMVFFGARLLVSK